MLVYKMSTDFPIKLDISGFDPFTMKFGDKISGSVEGEFVISGRWTPEWAYFWEFKSTSDDISRHCSNSFRAAPFLNGKLITFNDNDIPPRWSLETLGSPANDNRHRRSNTMLKINVKEVYDGTNWTTCNWGIQTSPPEEGTRVKATIDGPFTVIDDSTPGGPQMNTDEFPKTASHTYEDGIITFDVNIGKQKAQVILVDVNGLPLISRVNIENSLRDARDARLAEDAKDASLARDARLARLASLASPPTPPPLLDASLAVQMSNTNHQKTGLNPTKTNHMDIAVWFFYHEKQWPMRRRWYAMYTKYNDGTKELHWITRAGISKFMDIIRTANINLTMMTKATAKQQLTNETGFKNGKQSPHLIALNTLFKGVTIDEISKVFVDPRQSWLSRVTNKMDIDLKKNEVIKWGDPDWKKWETNSIYRNAFAKLVGAADLSMQIHGKWRGGSRVKRRKVTKRRVTKRKVSKRRVSKRKVTKRRKNRKNKKTKRRRR
jgi:hypothetical protein